MEKFDLIVVGSGPAGQRAAIQAAKYGKHVVLVEKLEVIGNVKATAFISKQITPAASATDNTLRPLGKGN